LACRGGLFRMVITEKTQKHIGIRQHRRRSAHFQPFFKTRSVLAAQPCADSSA
jgi:hypothetical protein